MSSTKGVLIYFAADILCLFIASVFTAAGSTFLLDLLCTLFTVLILAALLFDQGMSCTRKKRHRKDSGTVSAAVGGISAIPAASWIMLLLSKHGAPDFYRFHKLLNVAFLKVFNFIEHDASSDALSHGEIMLMLPFVFAAPAAFAAGYLFGKRNKVQ